MHARRIPLAGRGWFALLLPEAGRCGEKYANDKDALLRMEFKGFVNAFIRLPCQVIRTARQIVFRLMAWKTSQALVCPLNFAGTQLPC